MPKSEMMHELRDLQEALDAWSQDELLVGTLLDTKRGVAYKCREKPVCEEPNYSVSFEPKTSSNVRQIF